MTKIAKRKGLKEFLEFFGFKEFPFITDELRGKDIRRFVDRKDELQDLKISVELNRNYAVIGDTGTGKSSLLLKFLEEIKNYYYTNYIYFSMDAKTDKEMKEEHFRNILTTLLTLIVGSDELMDHYDPEEIFLETYRLDFSISIEDFVKKTWKSHRNWKPIFLN
ncbi:MAG: hypothetical protein GTO45_03030 [Candidatus Aminicenantes bacterium]|nr:hypothetical protein [Candidatus Aminicenantes bacterium]NIM77700.1 hypothetical protein [Candidatus Aminicenantes bacterium]NIN17013.1 hypothetical protein [Candidatus Aminicenantes bacterium]NIN40906.1 hypothetical protein [Candidatus Aminicenantes bacterium]NIN83711.1 hypothetical protein [Candidatus Aminicenantes bacterium]